MRQALLPFLQLLAFDHQFLLSNLAAMREYAVSALADAHVEVRELASNSLSSLLRVVSADEAKQLTVRVIFGKCISSLYQDSNPPCVVSNDPPQTRFAKMAATPLPKSKGGQLTPEESNARIIRHSGVLGLIGLVHTQPYELPDVRSCTFRPLLLPAAGSSRAVVDRHIVTPCSPRQRSLPHQHLCAQGIFRGLFSRVYTRLRPQFFRTHQDMWHVYKEKFSRDDLYTINQLILSPSYYA